MRDSSGRAVFPPAPSVVFEREYHYSSNIMTPDVMEMGRAGTLYWELSRGTGMCGEPIYGVTVLQIRFLRDPAGEWRVERRHDLMKCFKSMGNARSHISGLKDSEFTGSAVPA